MSIQHKLFTYTRNDDLLTGSEVIEADRTRLIIEQLQSDKQMVENWTLDIFCRDPSIISDIIITIIDPASALGAGWRYGISILNTPTSTCISPYELTIAWFGSEEEAKAMLETGQAYLRRRYGIQSI